MTAPSAERVLLAHFLADPDGAGRLFAERLTGADFPTPAARSTFVAMSDALASRRGPSTTYTILRYVNERHASSSESAQACAETPAETYMSQAGELLDPDEHLALFVEWSRRQRLGSICEDIAFDCFEDGGVDAATAEAKLERRLVAFRAGASVDRVFDDAEAHAAEAEAYLDEDDSRNVAFGFRAWDRASLPLIPGTLTLIGGASGNGKSTVKRNLVANWVDAGHPVAQLSLEMRGRQEFAAMACMHAGLPIEDYYRKRFTPEQRARFHDALEYWKSRPNLRLNDRSKMRPDDVLRAFARYVALYRTLFPTRRPVVVLDHMHRVDYGVSDPAKLRLPIANFARDLKSFANDEDATVVALVQYTKIKPFIEPDDDNIREANQILEEAEATYHIWRPMVCGEPDGAGGLRLIRTETGGRVFPDDPAGKGLLTGPDNENVFIKIGKQRTRISDGYVRVPFDRRAQRMYDVEDGA